ncbi:hypothetical protein ACHAPT_008306 [Fusarium lateritium]
MRFSDDLIWVWDTPRPRFPGDPEPNREILEQLQRVFGLEYDHRPQTWGFVIVRTAYGEGSDDMFQHALGLINRVAKVYIDSDIKNVQGALDRAKTLHPFEVPDILPEVDTRPNEELLRRFENDVLEDPALEGASRAAVRNYFAEWMLARSGWRQGNIRFTACILLDAETLAQLAEVPIDVQNVRNTSYWVKMVEATPPPEEPFRVRLFGPFGLAQYWFDRNHHQRTADWFLCDPHPQDRRILYYGEPLGFSKY